MLLSLMVCETSTWVPRTHRYLVLGLNGAFCCAPVAISGFAHSHAFGFSIPHLQRFLKRVFTFFQHFHIHIRSRQQCHSSIVWSLRTIISDYWELFLLKRSLNPLSIQKQLHFCGMKFVTIISYIRDRKKWKIQLKYIIIKYLQKKQE
jgi:hypothetical protein